MPLQEFLASYAVRVDEDGARRLQRILEQNRSSGQQLARVFSDAAAALAALKKELSSTSGLKNLFSGLLSGSARAASAALPAPAPGPSGAQSPGFSSRSGPAGRLGALSGLPGGSALPVAADFTPAEDAFAAFKSRLESERPALRVSTSGISSAVSSAIASVRSMMSSLHVTVPVTAVPSLDTSGLSSGGGGGLGGRGGAGGSVLSRFGAGGRVASPTLALIAEEGSPEYVIPTDNDARAVPLLRALLRELSASAKSSLLKGAGAELPGAGPGLTADLPPAFESLRASLAVLTQAARSAWAPSVSGIGPQVQSVQAPVNIHVSASGASPEALGQSIYDTTQRALLKTLKGVFA